MGQSQLSVVSLQPRFYKFSAKDEIVGSDLATLLQIGAASFDDRSGEAPEFGDERVIIVRDKQTQRELQGKVGSFALVLTILQSKGMEFEDVFLYDFFTTGSYNIDFTILEKLLYERHFAGALLELSIIVSSLTFDI